MRRVRVSAVTGQYLPLTIILKECSQVHMSDTKVNKYLYIFFIFRRRREEITEALLIWEEDQDDMELLLIETFSNGRNLDNTHIDLYSLSDDECLEFFR